jgi:hypothetical protein
MTHITCKNCGTSNDYYRLNCINCGSLIRARIVNIDLWHIIWLVIDSPKKAFQKIIHAEHKNFIVLLGVLISLKIYFNAQFTCNLVFEESPDITHLMIFLAGSVIFFFILIVLISLIVKYLNSYFKVTTRFKDNLAVYIYSFIPLLIGLIFLLPVEYALFGNHWLIFNPSPFVIKPGPAWILVSLEIALHLWSVILTIVATFASTGRMIYSILAGLFVQIFVLAPYVVLTGLI